MSTIHSTGENYAMLKKLLSAASLAFSVLAFGGVGESQAAITHYATPDHYVYVPIVGFRDAVSCGEARLILENKGYHISKTIRCGGNYHKFSAKRRGFAYIIHVKAFELRP